MPVIKEKIGGVEYGFAPLKLKELRAIQTAKEQQTVFERFDEWKPMIESSMQRAGSQMPDIEEMDIEEASRVFALLIKGVMRASGVEVSDPGEEKPAAATELTGATSTASSSPLPAGA